MTKYLKTIYGDYKPTSFDGKLAKYIADRFFTKENTILDVGSGIGKYMKEFSRLGYRVAGVDKDTCDLEKEISVADNSAGNVFCKSVIEHVHNTDNFLSELYRVLKPGGTIVILTPAWEYNYKWFYQDYTHVRPFYKHGLTNALKIHGFKDVSVEYFHYLPITWKYSFLKDFLLQKYTKLNSKLNFIAHPNTKRDYTKKFSREVQLLGVAQK